MCSSKISDFRIFWMNFVFAWTLATSATSRGRIYNFINLNRVSNFSFRHQLSNEILFSGLEWKLYINLLSTYCVVAIDLMLLCGIQPRFSALLHWLLCCWQPDIPISPMKNSLIQQLQMRIKRSSLLKGLLKGKGQLLLYNMMRGSTSSYSKWGQTKKNLLYLLIWQQKLRVRNKKTHPMVKTFLHYYFFYDQLFGDDKMFGHIFETSKWNK